MELQERLGPGADPVRHGDSVRGEPGAVGNNSVPDLGVGPAGHLVASVGEVGVEVSPETPAASVIRSMVTSSMPILATTMGKPSMSRRIRSIPTS
ncbi:hypothetical protein [Nocardia sp. R7R-8]|uniref:hypothetical protein n=1 Tax=Nocardia sp. R7R-8 TaxID=3459304 RepID=UPI00403DA0BE